MKISVVVIYTSPLLLLVITYLRGKWNQEDLRLAALSSSEDKAIGAEIPVSRSP
jgi:hypothetical protein